MRLNQPLVMLLCLIPVLAGCEPTADSEIRSSRDDKESTRAPAGERQPVKTEALYEDVKQKYGVPPDLDHWELQEWANSSPLSLNELRGHVVVVRFWTNTCPYCAKSMPVLQNLKTRLREKPVRFVGIYHPKPRGKDRPWEKAVRRAEKWDVQFPIAHDPDWDTLTSWWLSTGRRDATSCTFVFNHRGHVTYIHPGPVYYPGDPKKSQPAHDFERLTAAIEHALERNEKEASRPKTE